MQNLNELTRLIIGKAIEVHRALGPGLLESAYHQCLIYELQMAGLKVEVEKPLPIIYKEIKLDKGYRADVLVNDTVLVEVKSVSTLTEVDQAQVLTYLRFSEYPIGLLINFNVLLLKDGLRRFVKNTSIN